MSAAQNQGAAQKKDAALQTRPRASWSVFAVAIVFGLFYAYDLFEAVSNLIGVPAQLAQFNEFFVENGLTPQPVPWAVLVANLLLPVAAYALALLLGRRRGLAVRALLFVAGLCAVAALTLTLTALV